MKNNWSVKFKRFDRTQKVEGSISPISTTYFAGDSTIWNCDIPTMFQYNNKTYKLRMDDLFFALLDKGLLEEVK